jgi:flagellar biosynthesis/type III secretory pathway M-ring protein FliF/YscJ
MKIDTNAFLQSLPIMGVGLLGIFIVTLVIIVGIYILKALTKNSKPEDEKKDSVNDDIKDKEEKIESKKSGKKKETALDLLREKQKTDFLEEVENNYISKDL